MLGVIGITAGTVTSAGCHWHHRWDSSQGKRVSLAPQVGQYPGGKGCHWHHKWDSTRGEKGCHWHLRRPVDQRRGEAEVAGPRCQRNAPAVTSWSVAWTPDGGCTHRRLAPTQAQHSTARHSTARHVTARRTSRHSTARHGTAQHNTARHSTAPSRQPGKVAGG